MADIALFAGRGLVIERMDPRLAGMLGGEHIGLPAAEAIVDAPAILEMIQDSHATGLTIRRDVIAGTLWVVPTRGDDGAVDGVGLHLAG